jgi:tetratricopeptide (TPR) repeat protein
VTADHVAGYLKGLPPAQAEKLARVNDEGLSALRKYLMSRQAVAFLGAGTSAPLYPLWNALIGELVDAAVGRLDEEEAATCRVLARQSPEEVVEIVRQQLGVASYREVLRGVLRVRTDRETGRSWTPVQELVCRCAFKAVVTTNYDPGIVDARMRVRPGASSTGFMTWEDELGLDRWRTGDVFGEAELPVLFAHGQHNRPDSVVLAATEYRRAYAGKLPHVLARLADGHLVWIGFSFADQRITAILREIADRAGPRAVPGGAPRHVAVMAWDPKAEGNDPRVLARRAEIAYGAQVLLYPALADDHSALGLLLSELTDPRFPAAGDLPTRGQQGVTLTDQPTTTSDTDIAVRWVSGAEPVAHFTGRAEELARLDGWAADPQVALIGVTAWGGAGKTALVTHWVMETEGPIGREGVRGVFGWSFYADPSAEHWATSLLAWARQDLGIRVTKTKRAATAVLNVLRKVPLLLVLDGLEVVQEGPAVEGFGRLLDGTLREVLAGICQQRNKGLVVLTSRFPFADLEGFDGATARTLDVPPFTAAEGAALLAATGAVWLNEEQRRALVAAVDGHALATAVLAGLLAARPPAKDLAALRTELAEATRTDVRVGKVLQFYAGKLAEPDRYLLAAVSLFTRPTDARAVLAVAAQAVSGSQLAGWTPAMVREAVQGQLAGLASWHPDGTISAHPLVRDTFRPLVLGAAPAAAQTALADMPAGKVTTRSDALRVVEAIELLLDANHWQPANGIYQTRCDNGDVWKHLPAARLGQRSATAFVATPGRRNACITNLTPDRLGYYLNAAGLFAMNAGDLATASEYLHQARQYRRDSRDVQNLATSLRNLAECLGYLGQIDQAWDAATEALGCAQAVGDRLEVRYVLARFGWLASLAGDTAQAEKQFTAADQVQLADDPRGDHLYSIEGTWWAEWLTRTGRPGPAQALIQRNIQISRRNGWEEHIARCDRVLGRLALAAGDTITAEAQLTTAAAVFRDGDYLIELTETLVDLAGYALAVGDLDGADRYATEAISIAAPRGLVPAQSAALAARACTRAAQAIATKNLQDLLEQGRDAADSALRLAARHRLPWHELSALSAHAIIDQAEGADQGWAARAHASHSRLVPRGLDPHPLDAINDLPMPRKIVSKKPPTLARAEMETDGLKLGAHS